MQSWGYHKYTVHTHRIIQPEINTSCTPCLFVLRRHLARKQDAQMTKLPPMIGIAAGPDVSVWYGHVRLHGRLCIYVCVCEIDICTPVGTRGSGSPATCTLFGGECLGSTAQHIPSVSRPGEIRFIEGCGTTRWGPEQWLFVCCSFIGSDNCSPSS